MYREKIIDIKTGEETWRDYTPEEIAEVEKAQAEAQARAEAEAQAAAEKQAAREAVFTKLGLTQEETRLLLS